MYPYPTDNRGRMYPITFGKPTVDLVFSARSIASFAIRPYSTASGKTHTQPLERHPKPNLPATMSRLNHLQTLVRSLNPTPLRTSNSAQLSSALENIVSRTFPSSSSVAAGSGEERAVDGMIKSLERLRAGQAMMDVSGFFLFGVKIAPIPIAAWRHG